jgi:uncharacterized integral membrane protein (TIGR00698 family)
MQNSTGKPADLSTFLQQQISQLLPGLIIIVIVGIASTYLAQIIPRIGDVTISILLGVIVGNLIPNLERFNPGILFSEKKLLTLAIALLGVELQLFTLLQSGVLSLVVIVVSVAVSLLVSVQVGKMMGFSRKFSVLMGAGNGICGSSAVAATSAVIHAEEKDIGIAISVVNLLGIIGIFLLPALTGLLAFPETSAGLVIGATLQAVGQVVAAGFAVGNTAGALATAVKMGRVLMLGPVVVMLHSLMIRRQGEKSPGVQIKVPLFIIGFFVLSVFASLNIAPDLVPHIKNAGRFLLVVAMAGIGMRIQLQTLFRSGPGALLFGAIIWFTQIATITVLVLIFGA